MNKYLLKRARRLYYDHISYHNLPLIIPTDIIDTGDSILVKKEEEILATYKLDKKGLLRRERD